MSLAYSGGIANTAMVLAYVRTVMLTSAAGHRADVPTVIVILTDGPSRDPLAARVSLIQQCYNMFLIAKKW